MGAVMQVFIYGGGMGQFPSALATFMHGLHSAFLVSFALSLVAMLVAALRPSQSLKRHLLIESHSGQYWLGQGYPLATLSPGAPRSPSEVHRLLWMAEPGTGPPVARQSPTSSSSLALVPAHSHAPPQLPSSADALVSLDNVPRPGIQYW